MRLVIYHAGDEERVEIYAVGDGKSYDIITVTYDDVGWSGLEAVQQTAKEMALLAGWRVEHSR